MNVPRATCDGNSACGGQRLDPHASVTSSREDRRRARAGGLHSGPWPLASLGPQCQGLDGDAWRPFGKVKDAPQDGDSPTQCESLNAPELLPLRGSHVLLITVF